MFCPSFYSQRTVEGDSSTAFEVAAAKSRRVVRIRFLTDYRTEEQDEMFIPIRQFET